MKKFSFLFSSVTVILVLVCVYDGNAFNLSPKPNIILREPKSLGNGMPKIRSSYFGFSLNLKQNSVLVGAPRAQSTLESQQKINETGAIYKCTFDKSSTGNCSPFVFDKADSYSEANNELTFNNEKKDHQWLGASMDGSASDNDKFVVCAPRLISDQSKYSHYLLHGVCYWTTNTSSNEPINVQKIAPLHYRGKQQFKKGKNDTYFYYIYGEQGLNVHITENKEEILIGAPGIFGWKGSIIRHKAKPLVDVGGLSRRKRRQSKSDFVEYGSDIPNPMLWDQEYDSYFGFAVSSGYFDGIEKSKLLYVASAPKANLQHGAVYIFDIVDHADQFSVSEKTIKIYHTFSGQQLGEYFGYSLLTEDFNNDGLTDIAIGAPYNSEAGIHENGAVYIYKNEGSSSNFALHTILRTDYELSGRFGTTISKVGDINQDGFNDLIVAAPFEENGVIYIYHGSSNGLPTKYSQRIISPSKSLTLNQMFGHGLSKGADMDGNNYLDIAVGSPNIETVYIYKSYPVIRVNTTISPFSPEIQTTDKSFKFNVCWLYESTHPIDFDVHFNAAVKLDGQLGRAIFQDRKNEYDINSKITSEEQCILLETFVTFSIVDIFRPIELEMTHHVLNDITNNNNSDNNEANETQEFCKTCVAVNPNDSKTIKNKIVFSTGCKNARCTADLKLKSSLENVSSLPYILGSSSSLTIAYAIVNSGETAYLAKIRITLPDSDVLFTKTPSNCKLDETAPNSNIMECDLNNGIPMFKGDKTLIKISIDTTKLDGSELIIRANVSSTGDEQNPLDNEDEKVIPLQKFSNVEIFGDSTRNQLILQSEVERENVSHTFEIRNNGPSNIKSVDILVSLPISLINPLTLEREKLIDTSSVSIKSVYNGQQFDVEWSQNNTILDLHADDSLQSTQTDLKYIEGTLSINEENSMESRNRRSLENEQNSYFNPYLQKVIETNQSGSFDALKSERFEGDSFSVNDRILSYLPPNRTIHFNCEGFNQKRCLMGKIRVSNFKASDSPILITLNFTIDMTKMSIIMSGKRDILVIRTSVELAKTTDDDISKIQFVQNQPFTVISKYVNNSTPLIIYILSIIFGLLSLIFISYALFRFGFFRRGTRDELVKLKRQSELRSYWVVPGDGLEDDHLQN